MIRKYRVIETQTLEMIVEIDTDLEEYQDLTDEELKQEAAALAHEWDSTGWDEYAPDTTVYETEVSE